MLQENAAKSNIEFIPDEEPKQQNDFEEVTFTPDENQPNLMQADIKDDEGLFSKVMNWYSDAVTAQAQLENLQERQKGEMISGAVQGSVNALIGQPTDIVGTSLKLAGDIGNMPIIKELGSEMSNKANALDEFLGKRWISEQDEKIDPRISQISKVMASGGMQILPMQASSKYLGGALTYTLYTVPDAGETYFGAREEGKSKSESALLGGAVGAGFYTIDRFVDGAKLMKGMQNTAGGLFDVLLNAGKEAGAESLQEAYKNLVTKVGYDDSRNLMEGVLESAIGGFAGGGVAQMSVSIGGVEYNPSERFNDARQTALNNGATEQDIGTAMSELYNIMDNNPELASNYLTGVIEKNAAGMTDLIRQMPTNVAYQGVDEFYKTADEFIKNNEGTPEAKEAQKIKTELDEAYRDTYNALENLMPKEQAEANAKLVQGHALFASREFGISPKQYMDTMFASVEFSDPQKFLSSQEDYIPYQRIRFNENTFEAFNDIKTADGTPIKYAEFDSQYNAGTNREAILGRNNIKVVRMSPQQYLSLTPQKMGSKDVTELENAIKNGNEIAMPFLEVEILDPDKKILKIVGHEGRHRSLAMQNLGTNDGYSILDSRDFYRHPELFKQGLNGWKILGQNETDVSKAVQLPEDAREEYIKEQKQNIYYQDNISKENQRRIAHRTESNLTPEEQEAFDRYFAEHPNKKRVKANLKRLEGTPYALHLMDQILATQAIYDLMDGKDVKYETGLTERQIDAIKGNGIEGLQNWYTANSIITGNEKTGGASVNSSYMNCNPSKLCAKFCYAATRGHLAMAASDNKASIIEILAEKAPTWLADAIAREYKVTAQYRSKLALRLFDKGDGDVAWLPVIKRLNENGVRVAIFSKRPNFIREVNKLKKNGVPFNLTMLSIDSSNVALADANKDLKIALVVSGRQDFDMVRKLKDRIQVLLPVHVGGKMAMPKADLEALKKEIPSLVTEKKICPISSNEKEKSAFILGTTELANPEKGWNCAHCDQTGCGCYFGSTTKQILEAIRGEVENGNLTLAKLGAKISTITKLIEELNNGQKITEEDYEGLGEGYTKAARLLVSDTGSVEETRRARGSELIRLTLLLRATMDDIQQQLGREADKTADKGSVKQDESKRGRDKEVLSKPSGSEKSSSVRGLSELSDRAKVLNNKVYFQSGYVSMRNPLVGTQLDADAHYGEGEHGNMAHGWGNYLLLDRETNYLNYFRKFNKIDVLIKGDKVNKEIPVDYVIDMENLLKATFAASPNPTGDEDGNIKWAINSVIKNRENYIEQLSQELDEKEKALSKKGFIKNKAIREDMQYEIDHIKKLINAKRTELSFYKKITPDMVTIKGGTAEQHEFDVPEVDELLNEELDFYKQPIKVRDALKEVANDLGIYVGDLADFDGYGIYDKIRRTIYETHFDGYDMDMEQWDTKSRWDATAKEASKLLNRHGVKGIYYEGGMDGKGVVIFNKEDTKHIQRLLQEKMGTPRGAYYNGIIHLFQNADASTFVHESMHFYREELKRFQDKSARAKSILNTLDNFAENEFEKNYKVKASVNGYSVVDKNGRTVYNNQGNLFDTSYEAKEYAKEEIIARGFEQYVREGKSPSKYLARAFHSFMNWLKHLYKTAKSLGVELNDDVRQAYGDLLGGQDLDYWMGQPAENIMSETQSVEKDRKAYLDDIIADAVANKGTTVSQGKGKGAKDIWTKAMIPLSTRAKRITQKLRNRLRKFEFNLVNELNKKYDQSRPFMDIWKKMSEDDAIAFDLALKNDYVEKQQEIILKYGAQEQWEEIKNLLENIYSDALNVGLDLGYRKDYFPRKVKDVEGFMAYVQGLEDWTRYQQALKEADPANVFTMEEKAEFLNKYLRGFVRVDLMPVKYGSEKTRKIPVVNNDINKFYADSMESYISYIEGMNARIESAKFLGKDAENYEESIGGYLEYLQNNGLVDPSQIDDVREILQARFGQRGVGNRFLATARDLSYIYTMGGINSAITQLEDFSVSMYKAGVWNTLTTIFGEKQITKKDLGIERISQEFVDGSKTSQWLNKMFKATGLDGIDGLGKETLVNAVLKKYKQIYAKDPQALRDYIEPIMEDQTNATINDILNGEKSDNLKFLLFNELSDVQPISLSELPEFYNKSENMRVLYMLKSFMVKRIDTFRNEAFDKIRSKNRDTRIQGMKNLLSMSVLMMLCGATKDWIIDLLYGRKTVLPELMVNNLLGLFGITKFHLYKAREQGFTGVAKELVVPPLFSFFDDLVADVSKVSGGERKIKDMEVLKGIPLVGRFYYWWIGGGAEKQKKKNKKKR